MTTGIEVVADFRAVNQNWDVVAFAVDVAGGSSGLVVRPSGVYHRHCITDDKGVVVVVEAKVDETGATERCRWSMVECEDSSANWVLVRWLSVGTDLESAD